MLCLTRIVGEKIHIGDDVVIVVQKFGRQNGRNKVTLGIEAPRHVTVHRGEVYQRIKDEERFPERGDMLGGYNGETL